MPIQPNELKVDAIYLTPTDQLRRIDKIEDGKVHYSSSGNNAPHSWTRPHLASNPPTIETFCDAVKELYINAD